MEHVYARESTWVWTTIAYREVALFLFQCFPSRSRGIKKKKCKCLSTIHLRVLASSGVALSLFQQNPESARALETSFFFFFTFDGADGGGRESVREIVLDGGRIGGRIVVGIASSRRVIEMMTTRRVVVGRTTTTATSTTTTTIPQVQHGYWRAVGSDVFHRHLLLIRCVVVMVILLMVRMIRPGRVETRLAGRRQSTRFHHFARNPARIQTKQTQLAHQTRNQPKKLYYFSRQNREDFHFHDDPRGY